MDSAAELAVKNLYVQNKSKNDPVAGSRYLVGWLVGWVGGWLVGCLGGWVVGSRVWLVW